MGWDCDWDCAQAVCILFPARLGWAQAGGRQREKPPTCWPVHSPNHSPTERLSYDPHAPPAAIRLAILSPTAVSFAASHSIPQQAPIDCWVPSLALLTLCIHLLSFHSQLSGRSTVSARKPWTTTRTRLCDSPRARAPSHRLHGLTSAHAPGWPRSSVRSVTGISGQLPEHITCQGGTVHRCVLSFTSSCPGRSDRAPAHHLVDQVRPV